MLKNALLLKEISKSFELFRRNIIFVPILAFLDMFFFIVAGFFRQFIYIRILEKIISLKEIMDSSPGLGNLTESDLIRSAVSHFKFTQGYNSLFYLLLLFVGIVFLIYVIINCISWALVTLMVHKKLKIMQYIKRFILLNLFWFLVIMIIAFLLRKSIAQLVFGFSPLTILLLVVLAFIFYFVFISYPLIVKLSLKKALGRTFTTGFKKSPRFGLMYIYCIFALFFADFIMRFLQSISSTLMFIAGILIVLPLFGLIRVFITTAVLEKD